MNFASFLSLEKREKIKSQIKSAFFYPGVLFTVAIGARQDDGSYPKVFA